MFGNKILLYGYSTQGHLSFHFSNSDGDFVDPVKAGIETEEKTDEAEAPAAGKQKKKAKKNKKAAVTKYESATRKQYH